MSSFKIIQISAKPVTEDERISDFDLGEDDIINMRSDYIQSEKPWDDELGERIRQELSAIATVDIRKKTITFLPKEILRKKCLDWVQKAVEDYKKDMGDKTCTVRHHRLQQKIEDFFGIDSLFWGTGENEFAMTSGYVIDDYLSGLIPQKLYIGTVYTAHC